MSRKKTTEEFIAEARLVHSNFYDYSKTNYIDARHKVEIVCPIHGSFWQIPNNHTVNHQGCPKCLIKDHKGVYVSRKEINQALGEELERRRELGIPIVDPNSVEIKVENKKPVVEANGERLSKEQIKKEELKKEEEKPIITPEQKREELRGYSKSLWW